VYRDGLAITLNVDRMLDRSLKEEQVFRVDERLTRVVRIIVEQYDGDVRAFVESIRYTREVNRKAHAASDHGDEATWQHDAFED
jgi:hypothetical protein